MAFSGIACESMQHLLDFTASAFPQLEAVRDIAALSVREVCKAVRRAGADAVLLVGGPPCPPFSPLSGNPRGWEDKRTEPLRHFARLKKELAEMCQREGWLFRWLM